MENTRKAVNNLFNRLKAFIALLAFAQISAATATATALPSCAKPVYLTLDTGNMKHAELIAQILHKHEVKATFFLANEKTSRGDFALDASWAEYWKARVKEGHRFGSHTFDHVYFKGLVQASHQASGFSVSVRPQFGTAAGRDLVWDEAQVCRELKRVDERFSQLTQQRLAPIWRAPGGRAPQAVFDAMKACGYKHVYWAKAGFLGDELASEQYPNQTLLQRALNDIQSGDILMAHLGIWARKDPFAPMLDPLIAGLKAKGFCFALVD